MMSRISTLTKWRHAVLFIVATGLTGAPMNAGIAGDNAPARVLDFTMKNIDGKDVPLSTYKGNVLLIVNVASRCGFTPQYAGLEALYRKYREKGFVILGFPANNFLWQEPGTDAEIKTFCTTTYDVTFDLFSKISVKGDDQHPLYKFITSDAKFGGNVKWNFQKWPIRSLQEGSSPCGGFFVFKHSRKKGDAVC
jgi:glutathione peroxidase